MGSVRCWEGSTTTNTPSGEPPLPAPCLIRLHSPLENGPFPNSACPYRRWQTTRFHDGSHFGMRPLEQRRPANKGPPPVPPATLRSPQPSWLKRRTRLGRRGKKGGSHPRLKHCPTHVTDSWLLCPLSRFPKKGTLKNANLSCAWACFFSSGTPNPCSCPRASLTCSSEIEMGVKPGGGGEGGPNGGFP